METTSYNKSPGTSDAVPFPPLASVSTRLKSAASIVLPALIFLLAVVYVNRDLFKTPYFEPGDVAVNAIQVQNAIHLRELTGNYSRWHFHHPGPFFFYVFAAGEVVFFNFLHLVPAPLNGEFLAEIICNVLCLFVAIYIIQVNIKQSLFPPIAVLASIFFFNAVNTAIPASALISLWPPYMSSLTFLLMVVCCASVSSGQWQHVWILAFAAMATLHSHMVQILFASVLSSSSVAIAIWRDYRANRVGVVLRTYRKQLVAALAIVALFAFPILLETVIHHPSNMDHVTEYLRTHHGEHNPIKVVLLYVASFFLFNPTPEGLLASPKPTFAALLVGAPALNGYWVGLVALSLFGATLMMLRRRPTNKFLKYLLLQILFVTILFIYWSWRITGPMYNFNGYFFLTAQLLIIWSLAIIVLAELPLAVNRPVALILCCSFSPLIALTHGLRVGNPMPEIGSIADAIQAQHPKNVELIMPAVTNIVMPGWGVASYLQRKHIPFCLSPEWEVVFGPEHVCHAADSDTRYKVQFAEGKLDCENGCSVLYRAPGIYVTGESSRERRLTPPALIRASVPTFLSSGFNGVESDGAWTEQTAEIRFSLGTPPGVTGTYAMSVMGIGLPGRPATIRLNGSPIGKIEKSSRGITTFHVDSSSLTWNKPNSVTFEVPGAGPVGKDTRTLGYFLQEVLIAQETSSKSYSPFVKPISEDLANRVIAVPWQADAGWALDGFYPDVGRLTKGLMWGSWNGNDRNTGRLTSAPFTTDPSGCVVIPVAHGPSIHGQKVVLLDEKDHPVVSVPIDSTSGAWQLFEIHFSPVTQRIRVIGEDDGRGWGEWLALGEPRSCGN